LNDLTSHCQFSIFTFTLPLLAAEHSVSIYFCLVLRGTTSIFYQLFSKLIILEISILFFHSLAVYTLMPLAMLPSFLLNMCSTNFYMYFFLLAVDVSLLS